MGISASTNTGSGKTRAVFPVLAAFLPPLLKLGDFLAQAYRHYAMLHDAGVKITPDIVATFLVHAMRDWNPQVSGCSILDDETKAGFARGLAGVVMNVMQHRDAG